MMEVHSGLILSALFAGLSIGCWIGLYFNNPVVLASIALGFLCFVTFGTALCEKFFGGNSNGTLLASYTSVWMIAFLISLAVTWATTRQL